MNREADPVMVGVFICVYGSGCWFQFSEGQLHLQLQVMPYCI
jgi:hypothetical protein